MTAADIGPLVPSLRAQLGDARVLDDEVVLREYSMDASPCDGCVPNL